MAMELHYTSAPQGILPGTSGFSIVALTSGMTKPMIQKLEQLSGYRPIYPLGSPKEHDNPVSFCHWRADIGGKYYNIISRVCSAEVEYTQRSNKYAHHIVLDTSELVPAGPAWVMMQPGVFRDKWDGKPQWLEPKRLSLPPKQNPLRICEAWAKATGDAGWAGVLADSFLRDASIPAYILYEPGMDLLPLMDEAIALLPEHARWRVTFNTFFMDLPAGLSCSWRCCVVNTDAAQSASSRANSGVIIDLTKRKDCTLASRYVIAARTGRSAVTEKPVTPIPLEQAPAVISKSAPQQAPRDKKQEYDLVPILGVEEHAYAMQAPRASKRGRNPIIYGAVALIGLVLVLGIAATFIYSTIRSDRASIVLLKAEKEDFGNKLSDLDKKYKDLLEDFDKLREEKTVLESNLKVSDQEKKELRRELEQNMRVISQLSQHKNVGQKNTPSTKPQPEGMTGARAPFWTSSAQDKLTRASTTQESASDTDAAKSRTDILKLIAKGAGELPRADNQKESNHYELMDQPPTNKGQPLQIKVDGSPYQHDDQLKDKLKNLSFGEEMRLPDGWKDISDKQAFPNVTIVGRHKNEIVYVSLVGDPVKPQSDQILAKSLTLDGYVEMFSKASDYSSRKEPIEKWRDNARMQLRKSADPSNPTKEKIIFHFSLVDNQSDRKVTLEVEK